MTRSRAVAISSAYAEAGVSTVFLQSMPTNVYADPPTDACLLQYTCPPITPANISVFNIGNSLMNILPFGIGANNESTFSIDFNAYAYLTQPLVGQALTNNDIAAAVQDMLNDPLYGVAAVFNPIYTTLNRTTQFTAASFVVTWQIGVGYTITNTDNIPVMLDFDIPASIGILLGFGTMNELAFTVTHTSIYVPVDISTGVAEDFVFICSNLIRTMDDGTMVVRYGVSIHNDAMFAIPNGGNGTVSPNLPTVSIRGSPLYQAVVDQRTTGVASIVYLVYSLKLASGLAVNNIDWSMLISLIFQN
jgi:hypothetical protein